MTIHVVGAGFSGLSLAYLLAKTGLFNITVFEKKSHVGGMIQSSLQNGGVVESAANSILCNSQVLDLLNEIEADYIRPLPTAKKRYFFRHKVTRWPLRFFETLCFIPRIIFFLLSTKRFESQETVKCWAEKKLGRAFTKHIISPALQGIYATTADHLNASIVLGPMFKKKKYKYQGIVSGRKGMQDIAYALEKKCHEYGVQFKLNTEYAFDTTADAVVVCTAAPEAAAAVMLQHPELSKKLKNIPMNTVLSVTYSVPGSQRPKGFGCLIAENEKIKALGILFNTDIFASRESETLIFSASEAEKVAALSVSAMNNYILETRKNLFHLNESISDVQKFYWPQGLPIYNQELAEFQNALTLPKNLYLHGNYLSGIGLSKIIANSFELSEKITKDLQ